MPTNKPQTSQGISESIQSDLIRVKERMEYLPNPLDPIRTLVDFATGTFIKGVWNGIWSFVTNPHVDYGTGGSGDPPTTIREAKDATQRMVEQLRQRHTQ
jgi:hypothetical protein